MPVSTLPSEVTVPTNSRLEQGVQLHDEMLIGSVGFDAWCVYPIVTPPLSSRPIFLFFFSHLPTNSQHSLLSTFLSRNTQDINETTTKYYDCLFYDPVRVRALSRPSLWLFVLSPDLLPSPTSIVHAQTRTHDLDFHSLLGLLGPRPSIYWFSG
jgi:hypothetical protein